MTIAAWAAYGHGGGGPKEEVTPILNPYALCTNVGPSSNH